MFRRHTNWDVRFEAEKWTKSTKINQENIIFAFLSAFSIWAHFTKREINEQELLFFCFLCTKKKKKTKKIKKKNGNTINFNWFMPVFWFSCKLNKLKLIMIMRLFVLMVRAYENFNQQNLVYAKLLRTALPWKWWTAVALSIGWTAETKQENEFQRQNK